MCLSGLVNFSQYGLDALTHGLFRGNPIPINIALAGAGFVAGSVLVAFVRMKGGDAKPKELERGTPYERERLLPEEDVVLSRVAH